MRRIFPPGNERGFVLLDALVALFIALVGIAAIFGTLSVALRNAASGLERAALLVEARNELAQRMVHHDTQASDPD